MRINRFIQRLEGRCSTEIVANPYNCYVENIDADQDVSRQRRLHLSAYLRHRQATARTIFVAEAPGYQGARFSGVAMTSERLLSGARDFVTELDILGHAGIFQRTSHIDACRNNPERQQGFSEPTATIVWQAIMEAGRSEEVVLWNTFPFHPYREGVPLSNRAPTTAEINSEAAILVALRDVFDHNCEIVAIGNVAQNHLQRLEVEATHIRHPANGGAPAFRESIRRLLA